MYATTKSDAIFEKPTRVKIGKLNKFYITSLFLILSSQIFPRAWFQNLKLIEFKLVKESTHIIYHFK
jgi:hypothetical protein